jgi:hypothetical protein
MTGLLLFLGVIALLVVALEVTHHRSSRSWRPGLDTRRDRDLDRLDADLRAAAQREPLPPVPPALGYLTPRQMAQESRIITRAAA